MTESRICLERRGESKGREGACASGAVGMPVCCEVWWLHGITHWSEVIKSRWKSVFYLHILFSCAFYYPSWFFLGMEKKSKSQKNCWQNITLNYLKEKLYIYILNYYKLLYILHYPLSPCAINWSGKHAFKEFFPLRLVGSHLWTMSNLGFTFLLFEQKST